MKKTLISRDSKGKCRVINISCEKEGDNYVIKRSSGLFNGKTTNQPSIIITKGKVKRTIEEQSELQFNSLVKGYLDKGYIEVEESLTEELIDKKLPTTKTDQKGAKKPMLCKVLDQNNKNLTEKTW